MNGYVENYKGYPVYFDSPNFYTTFNTPAGLKRVARSSISALRKAIDAHVSQVPTSPITLVLSGTSSISGEPYVTTVSAVKRVRGRGGEEVVLVCGEDKSERRWGGVYRYDPALMKEFEALAVEKRAFENALFKKTQLLKSKLQALRIDSPDEVEGLLIEAGKEGGVESE